METTSPSRATIKSPETQGDKRSPPDKTRQASNRRDSDERTITPSQSVVRIEIMTESTNTQSDPVLLIDNAYPHEQESIRCSDSQSADAQTARTLMRKSHLPYKLWIMVTMWTFQLLIFAVRSFVGSMAAAEILVGHVEPVRAQPLMSLGLFPVAATIVITSGCVTWTLVEIVLFARHRLSPGIFLVSSTGKVAGSLISFIINTFCISALSEYVKLISLLTSGICCIIVLPPLIYSSIHYHRYLKWTRSLHRRYGEIMNHMKTMRRTIVHTPEREGENGETDDWKLCMRYCDDLAAQFDLSFTGYRLHLIATRSSSSAVVFYPKPDSTIRPAFIESPQSDSP